MSIITPEARERRARRPLKDQLEDLRKTMQQKSGAEDMRPVDAQLEHDDWKTRCERITLPIDGADFF